MSYRNRLLAVVLLTLAVAAGTATAQVITVSIVEKAGITTANYLVTLSMVFRQGDVTDHVHASVNSVNVNTQTDVKVRRPDGSVKHALVSFLVPTLAAGSTATVALYSGGTNYNTDWVTRQELEATAFGAATTVTVSGTPTTISARDMLASQRTEEHWIKGNICSEFISGCCGPVKRSHRKRRPFIKVSYRPPSGLPASHAPSWVGRTSSSWMAASATGSATARSPGITTNRMPGAQRPGPDGGNHVWDFRIRQQGRPGTRHRSLAAPGTDHPDPRHARLRTGVAG